MVNLGYFFRVIKNDLPLAGFLYLVCLAVLVVSCYFIARTTLVNHPIEIWVDGCQYLDFFLPFVSCVVVVPLIFLQKKKGFLQYASMRCGRKNYLLTQFLAVSTLVFLGTVFSYYISLVVTLTILKPQDVGAGGNLQNYVFGPSQIGHPYLFGIAWCAWKGIVAVVFSVYGCLAALFLDNMFVAVLLPFLYCVAENMVTSLLQIPEYSILTSYVLNRLSPCCMHIWNYFIGVVVFVVVGAAFLCVVSARGKNHASARVDKKMYGFSV